jgi:Putative MetA-pathway of phenol degradation
MTHSLPGRFSIASNLGVTWTTQTGGITGKDTAADFTYTALLGYTLAPEVDTYLEFFGSFPLEEQDDGHGFDAGVALRVLPTVQLDLFGGVGLNDAAVDVFISAGLSFRLP